MKLHALGSDYWPSTIAQPMVRLAVAAFATPLLVAAGLTLIVTLVGSFAPNRGPTPLGGPANLFFWLMLEIYLFALVAAAPAFLALWCLRLRSRPAYIAVALIGGLIGALISVLRFGVLPIGQLFIALALNVGLLLAVRYLAGLSESPPRFRPRQGP